jgi:hypothetical protein
MKQALFNFRTNVEQSLKWLMQQRQITIETSKIGYKDNIETLFKLLIEWMNSISVQLVIKTQGTNAYAK